MARERRGAKTQKVAPVRPRWRRWLAVVLTLLAFASIALAAHSVAVYVSADPRFRLSRERPGSLQVRGLVFASRAKVTRVFAGDFTQSLSDVPLDERRRRLLAIDWVEDASVSRLWPDRLVVSVRERQPVAFVARRSSLLVDRFGVLLEQPPQAKFAFPVIDGITEAQPEAERARRVAAMLDFLRELGRHARDISEVNVTYTNNLRVVTRAGDAAVELIMGETNYLSRYQTFLRGYPEAHERSASARVFDMRLDGRILERMD
jgi:cell division protein FtsQ